jgi:DNA-repair protein XRCC1
VYEKWKNSDLKKRKASEDDQSDDGEKAKSSKATKDKSSEKTAEKDASPKADKNRAPKRSNILHGVVFALSGFQNPLRSEIRDKGMKLGAKYRPDWTDDCTHLV